MYWDVVEVKPEPGYSLFVRFRDGLCGHVQLAREDLTGVLAPLIDVDFFERVFVDQGAVRWPGEIDLAPDAMHADLAALQEPAAARAVSLRSALFPRGPQPALLQEPSAPPAEAPDSPARS